MSYLQGPNLPSFKKAIISFWCRIPQASMDAAAADPPDDTSMLSGLVPLVVFGQEGTGPSQNTASNSGGDFVTVTTTVNDCVQHYSATIQGPCIPGLLKSIETYFVTCSSYTVEREYEEPTTISYSADPGKPIAPSYVAVDGNGNLNICFLDPNVGDVTLPYDITKSTPSHPSMGGSQSICNTFSAALPCINGQTTTDLIILTPIFCVAIYPEYSYTGESGLPPDQPPTVDEVKSDLEYGPVTGDKGSGFIGVQDFNIPPLSADSWHHILISVDMTGGSASTGIAAGGGGGGSGGGKPGDGTPGGGGGGSGGGGPGDGSPPGGGEGDGTPIALSTTTSAATRADHGSPRDAINLPPIDVTAPPPGAGGGGGDGGSGSGSGDGTPGSGGGNGGSAADRITATSLLYIAVDDVNYKTGPNSLFPNTNKVSTGAAGMIAAMQQTTNILTGEPEGPVPSYSLPTMSVPSGNLGIPSVGKYSDQIQQVQMAEFMMWLDPEVSFDTGVVENRRLFITAPDKHGLQRPTNGSPIYIPFNREAIGDPATWEPGADTPAFIPPLSSLDPSMVGSGNKLLHEPGVDFTKCSFNWQMGLNLGKIKGKVHREGKVKAYWPPKGSDPAIEAGSGGSKPSGGDGTPGA